MNERERTKQVNTLVNVRAQTSRADPAPSCTPCPRTRRRMATKGKGIQWNEGNLAENDEERLLANRMKIDEPKTPFHRLQEDGEEPEAFPPKAPPAKPGGRLHGDVVSMDMFDKIAQLAEVRQAEDEGPEEDPEEKRKNFNHGRKNHYKIGSLAELRKKAAEMDAEEDEDES